MVTLTDIGIAAGVAAIVTIAFYLVDGYLKNRRSNRMFEKISLSYQDMDKPDSKTYYYTINKNLEVMTNMPRDIQLLVKIPKFLKKYGIKSKDLKIMKPTQKEEDDTFDAMNLSTFNPVKEINGTDLSNITPEKRVTISGAYIGDLPPGSKIVIGFEPKIIKTKKKKETALESRNRKQYNPIWYFDHSFRCGRLIAMLPYFQRESIIEAYNLKGYESFRHVFIEEEYKAGVKIDKFSVDEYLFPNIDYYFKPEPQLEDIISKKIGGNPHSGCM